MSDSEYKTVLLGEPGVGKEELISKILENKFNMPASSSSQFIRKKINLPDEKSVTLSIFDVAGQKQFRGLAKKFYKDAKVVILVYDITNENSFTELKEYWYKEVKQNGLKDVIFVVVANRSELYNDMKVSNGEGKDFAKSIDAGFFCNSSLSNNSLEEMFQYIGKKLIESNNDFDGNENKKKEAKEEIKEEKGRCIIYRIY